MDDWKKWRFRALEAKAQCSKTDADLAEAISELTPRKAGRAQVNHWFNGKRQPTLEQFMVLCSELNADPMYILFNVAAPKSPAKPAKHYTSAPEPAQTTLQEPRARYRKREPA